MGLAASQARLLTITARLADNELRSQTINNAKMRLATQSAQASDEYVSALNNAQMMFSNIGTDGLAQNQALTYRALTQYSQYNTQYGLINSAGQILVSEEEAKIYEENRDSLEGYLKAHDLVWDTTFFDNGGNDYNSTTKKGGLQEKLTSFYTDNKYYIGDLFAGMTNQQLKNIYLDSLSMESSIEKMNYRKSAANLSSQKDEIYEKVIAPYRDDVLGNTKEEVIEEWVLNNIHSAEDLHNFLISGTVPAGAKPRPSGNYYVKHKIVQDYIIDDVPGTDRNDPNVYWMNWHKTVDSSLRNQITDCRDSITGSGTAGVARGFIGGDVSQGEDGMLHTKQVPVYKTKENGDYELDPETGKPILEGTKEASFVAWSGIKIYFEYPEDAYDPEVPKNERFTSFIEITDPDITVEGLTQSSKNPNRYACPQYTKWKNIDTAPWVNGKPDNWFNENVTNHLKKYKKDGNNNIIPNQYIEYHLLPNKNDDAGAWILPVPINEEVSKEEVYKAVTEQYLDALLGTEGYVDLLDYALTKDIEGLEELYAAIIDFNRYYDINQINPETGKKYFDLEHDAKTLIDFEQLIKLTNDNNTKRNPRAGLKDITYETATPAMKSVLGSYMAEMMLDVIGEPKFSWFDANDPNNTGNADAKAQWYTNLFNRMQKGYKVLENGLAKSQEWLEYAFESGLVTMEQVDLSFNWNALDYKSCSNIYEETDNSQTVSKAEAKYNRAMNDIKQKDSMYDLQLKNIDTEHQSLQTEYDVIKNVMNKNIERTMKFDQNG